MVKQAPRYILVYFGELDSPVIKDAWSELRLTGDGTTFSNVMLFQTGRGIDSYLEDLMFSTFSSEK
jgi:hypothetical protein